MHTANSRVTGIRRTGVAVIAVRGLAGYADATIADIIFGTCIAITACLRIVAVQASAVRITGIGRAHIPVITRQVGRTSTGPIRTHIAHCTEVPVIAWKGVVGIHTSAAQDTTVRSTGIAIVAIQAILPRAFAP